MSIKVTQPRGSGLAHSPKFISNFSASTFQQDPYSYGQFSKRLMLEPFHQSQGSCSDLILPSEIESLQKLFPLLDPQQLQDVLNVSENKVG
mmetsp:Transcript_1568/g.1524  ORF Transcript_1568/g.1524 Transcript_1568/m.1524 type:complete len:91 (-) Transcript_1568:811-1083(-)